MPNLHTEIQTTRTPLIASLYHWSAPERYWTKKDKGWYIIYTFFFLVLIIMLALMSEFILIVAVLAFMLLWFVQATVPPQIVEHIITGLGIKSFGKLYKWSDIKVFWFAKKDYVIHLNLDILNEDKPDAIFRRRITLLLNDGDDKKIFDTLIRFIDYGNKDEVGFNIFTQLVYGHYIDIMTYLPEDAEIIEEIGERKKIKATIKSHDNK